jgi:hypothetical protein
MGDWTNIFEFRRQPRSICFRVGSPGRWKERSWMGIITGPRIYISLFVCPCDTAELEKWRPPLQVTLFSIRHGNFECTYLYLMVVWTKHHLCCENLSIFFVFSSCLVPSIFSVQRLLRIDITLFSPVNDLLWSFLHFRFTVCNLAV